MDFFDSIRNSLEKYSDSPGEQVWQKLEQKIEKRAKKKRRIKLFLQLGTLALTLFLLLIAAGMVWYFAQKH